MATGAQYFVLTLPLITERWQEDILDKRMEVNRMIYNALLGTALKRYRQMAQTRLYRETQELLKSESDLKKRKELYRRLDGMTEQYRLRKFDLSRDAAQYRKYFKENTDSPIVQNLAVHVWKAIRQLISGKGREVHFKESGELNDLSGKTNAASIMYRDGVIKWKGLILPVKQKKNSYEREALQHEIRYCRIKRRMIRGSYHYYVDLVMKGMPPLKHPESCQASGKVGIDMGLQKLAYVSEEQMEILPLIKTDFRLEREKRRILRFLDRSRRATNPGNYRADGSILPGASDWNYSRHYKKEKEHYRELCRKQAAIRQQQHYELAGKLVSLGSRFYIEDLDFSKMRRRALSGANKGTKKQRSYGKEITCYAPSAFVTRLEQKCSQYGKTLVRLDPIRIKASGYDHSTGQYEKVALRRKWRMIEGRKVNKYLYSAFLLQHIEEETGTIDKAACAGDWQKFLTLQENCLKAMEKPVTDKKDAA